MIITPIENNFIFFGGFVFLFRELCYLCVIKVHNQKSIHYALQRFRFKPRVQNIL
jgi:hypothetical protein